MNKDRKWQEDANKIIDVCNNSKEKGNVIPVNACVGSGKTNIACYAFGSFIAKHREGKTIQMFITPRIRLCEQQAESIVCYVESRFGLKHHVDFDVIPRDCEHPGFDYKNPSLGARHVVFVVCDKSLWGDSDEDKEESSKRWNAWAKCFKAWESEGRKFGTVALDEAHNFAKDRLQKLIFGEVLCDDGK